MESTKYIEVYDKPLAADTELQFVGPNTTQESVQCAKSCFEYNIVSPHAFVILFFCVLYK